MRQSRLLSNLCKDRQGNFGPIGALGMLVAALLVGGGVDMSRMYMVKNRLQSACDAGALAGRRSVTTNGFDTTAQTVANNYFGANFNQAMSIAGTTTETYSTNDNGNTIIGSVGTQVASTVMAIFGYKTYALTTTCSATMAMGNSDVTMVLDTTGSMAQVAGSGTVAKIDGLKTAMKNFYDTVAASAAGSNSRIRYAFVPYNATVNVGKLVYALNPSYLVDSWKVQSREPIWTQVQVQTFDHWGNPVYTSGTGTSTVTVGTYTKYAATSYSSQNLCLAAMPANTAWVNSGGSSSATTTTINGSGQQVTTTTVTQPQSSTQYQCSKTSGKYYVYSATATRNAFTYNYATQDPVDVTVTQNKFSGFTYKQVTWDVSSYKAGGSLQYLNDSGTPVTTTWDGCLEERKTVVSPTFTFSTLTGMSPTGAYDLDIDSAPTSDVLTKWAPMVDNVAYLRGTASTPQNVATWTTGTQSVSNFYVCPHAAQGLSTMTQSDFYAYANSLSPGGTTYHDIGAIWGARLSSPDGIFASVVNDPPPNGGKVARHMIFMTDGTMNADNLIYSSYGIEFHDRRTTSDGNQHDDYHTSRFRAVCEAIKAKGIRLWVIGFGTALTTDLIGCASDQSAFSAANATQINTQFQQIAKQVGQLRITQ